MANTPLDKVKYKKADGSYSDNQPDVEKSDVNVDPSVSHLNKVQAGELMQLFEKTNNAIEQINKFIGTFNNEGNVDGIAQDQGIKWDASANKFVKTPLQTTTFDPKVIKVENSLGTKVGLDVMDGATDDKTLVSKGRLPSWKSTTGVPKAGDKFRLKISFDYDITILPKRNITTTIVAKWLEFTDFNTQQTYIGVNPLSSVKCVSEFIYLEVEPFVPSWNFNFQLTDKDGTPSSNVSNVQFISLEQWR